MVKNPCLAKSINDGSWYQFRVWLEYLGKVFERKTIAITPNRTSQEGSNCGTVKKSLSTPNVLDRDRNAARNILS
jgi:putative transposase